MDINIVFKSSSFESSTGESWKGRTSYDDYISWTCSGIILGCTVYK